jgi:shikimate kinase
VAADGRFTLYSLDDMIVEEAGMSIPDIVDTRGWAWFRDLEYDVCVKAARLAREDASGWTLIDAGGGVVVDLDKNGNETYSQRKVRRRDPSFFARTARSRRSRPIPTFPPEATDAPTYGSIRHPSSLVAFPSCPHRSRSPFSPSPKPRVTQIETLRGERNVIVYLKRDVAYLLNRTSGDKNRPSLSDDVSFQTLMERRAPWYFRAADYIVDASGGAVESAVKTKREIKEEVLEFYYAETGEEPPGAGSGARSR